MHREWPSRTQKIPLSPENISIPSRKKSAWQEASRRTPRDEKCHQTMRYQVRWSKNKGGPTEVSLGRA
jgi:hypothetical protein